MFIKKYCTDGKHLKGYYMFGVYNDQLVQNKLLIIVMCMGLVFFI